MKITLLIFSMIVCFITKGQELNSTHYTNNDGLPSNEVFGIAIDKKDYLWVCTDKGISKFDGSNFTTYTSIHGLKDNVFFNITHDYKDRIWLWSYNQQFNYIFGGKIYSYKYNHLLKQISKNLYLGASIEVGKDDKVFFSVNKEYFSISKNGKIEYYDYLIFGGKFIISYKNGVPKSEGVSSFDLSRLKFNNWFNPDPIGSRIKLYSINNTHYFIKGNELLITTAKSHKLKKFESSIESLCVDNKNSIWISLRGKDLLRYDDLDKTPKIILNKLSGQLIKDNNGNIWFSSSYKGLFKFQNTFIEKFEFKDANLLSVMLPTKTNIILRSYNGCQFDFFPTSKKVETINTTKFYDASHFLKKVIFNHQKVEFYGGLHIPLIFKGDTLSAIRAIQKINENYLVATSEQYQILSINDKSCTLYQTGVSKLKDIFYLNPTHVFIATIDGIYIQNTLSKKTVKIRDKIYANEHTQVIKKVDDYLLFGTKGKGVAVYSITQNRVINHYNSQNSEMPNSINAIFVQGRKIWIASNQGIFVYHFKSGKLTFENLLNKNNGLSSNDILGLFIENNTLYGLAENTLNCIQQSNYDLFNIPLPNSPEITSIKVFGKQQTLLNSIKTTYDKNDIEIAFNSSYLFDKNRISYYYRLNKNTKWYKTNSNELRLDNLPPGKYNLQLFTSFDHGKLKSSIENIQVTVSEPFYRTSEFKILLIIVVLSVIFSVISFYFYLKSKKAKRRMQIVEYQQQALRAQVKPHFIFNALNSIQNFVLKSKINEASDFIEKFSSLTRSILETSEYEYTTLKDELNTTQHYLEIEKIRFSNFDFNITLSDKIDAENTLVPSLILQPIVENAVWHGLQNKTKDEIGKIEISINMINADLSLIIEDNGVGREATLKKSNHNSKGLSLLKARLDLLKLKNVRFEFEDLYESGKPSGTRVIILLTASYSKKV